MKNDKILTIEYVSGFFDADGSISLIRVHSNEQKSVQVTFCNNERAILERIREFLKDSFDVKGAISTKRAKVSTHRSNYELKYTRNHGVTLIRELVSLHPKKAFRIRVVLKYYALTTRRNGKYSQREIVRKEAFDRLFYWEK